MQNPFGGNAYYFNGDEDEKITFLSEDLQGFAPLKTSEMADRVHHNLDTFLIHSCIIGFLNALHRNVNLSTFESVIS